MTTESEKSIVRSSYAYVEPNIEEKSPLFDRIKNWYDDVSQILPDDARETFEGLLEELEDVL